MAKKPSKGAAEIKRMRAQARRDAPKVTDTNFAAGPHPRRGEIADEQAAAQHEPRRPKYTPDYSIDSATVR